jgi:hypothetical protein
VVTTVHVGDRHVLRRLLVVTSVDVLVVTTKDESSNDVPLALAKSLARVDVVLTKLPLLGEMCSRLSGRKLSLLQG